MLSHISLSVEIGRLTSWLVLCWLFGYLKMYPHPSMASFCWTPPDGPFKSFLECMGTPYHDFLLEKTADGISFKCLLPPSPHTQVLPLTCRILQKQHQETKIRAIFFFFLRIDRSKLAKMLRLDGSLQDTEARSQPGCEKLIQGTIYRGMGRTRETHTWSVRRQQGKLWPPGISWIVSLLRSFCFLHRW